MKNQGTTARECDHSMRGGRDRAQRWHWVTTSRQLARAPVPLPVTWRVSGGGPLARPGGLENIKVAFFSKTEAAVETVKEANRSYVFKGEMRKLPEGRAARRGGIRRGGVRPAGVGHRALGHRATRSPRKTRRLRQADISSY